MLLQAWLRLVRDQKVQISSAWGSLQKSQQRDRFAQYLDASSIKSILELCNTEGPSEEANNRLLSIQRGSFCKLQGCKPRWTLLSDSWHQLNLGFHSILRPYWQTYLGVNHSPTPDHYPKFRLRCRSRLQPIRLWWLRTAIGAISGARPKRWWRWWYWLAKPFAW